MLTSQDIQEIAKAMAIAQGEIKPAEKDGANPHFKSKFSTLCAIWEAIRIPLTSHGLTVLQDITTQEKTVSVTTRIIHSSGQWIEFGPLSIPFNKNDAQGIGSATSYAKRYALCAAVGVISDEDDDGENAVGRGKNANKEQPKEEPPEKLYINAEMVKELNTLFDQCSTDYKKEHLSALHKIGVPSYAKLPMDMHARIVYALKKHVKEREEKIQQEKTRLENMVQVNEVVENE